ncbi:hypothetical protein ACOME3_000424 [Neoechinorhynchus agilis]
MKYSLSQLGLLFMHVFLLECRDYDGYIKQLVTSYMTGEVIEIDDVRNPLEGIKCSICKRSIDFIQKTVRQNRDYRLDAYAKLLCVFLSVSDVFDPILANDSSVVDMWIDLCEHAYYSYKPFVMTVLEQSNLTGSQMCQMMSICEGTDPLIDWTIQIPPPLTKDKDFNLVSMKSTIPDLKILHLSDIHVQMNYVPHSQAVCGRPVCCIGPIIDDDKRQAGYFGDHRTCDLPPWTLDGILEHISKNERFDIIYWTGDAPSHQIWNQSLVDNVKDNLYILKRLKKYFPDKPVYSTFGNHENWPCNMFPPSRLNDSQGEFMFRTIAAEWQKLGRLPSSATKTIEKSGIYTTLIKPKLRLISLNTNFAAQENFWLYINPLDPNNQLDWLVQVLKVAEMKQEKVHIIGHHFPARTLSAWSENYYKIVKRFNDTITSQFFGHEHQDYFTLFLDQNDLEPFSVAYMAPSLTTFPRNDPVYKIFSINLSSTDYGAVSDQKSVFLDINQSNANQNLRFFEEMNFKKEMNLTDLSLSSLIDLLLRSRMNKFVNDAMNKLIRRRYHSEKQTRNCDYSCRKSFACSMVSSKRNWTAWC